MKMLRLCNNQYLSRPSDRGINFNVVAIFPDTVNVICFKLCAMVALVVLYPSVQISVTLDVFQGHNDMKRLKVKVEFLGVFLFDQVETLYDC